MTKQPRTFAEFMRQAHECDRLSDETGEYETTLTCCAWWID
jgi:hypothetical protein